MGTHDRPQVDGSPSHVWSELSTLNLRHIGLHTYRLGLTRKKFSRLKHTQVKRSGQGGLSPLLWLSVQVQLKLASPVAVYGLRLNIPDSRRIPVKKMTAYALENSDINAY